MNIRKIIEEELNKVLKEGDGTKESPFTPEEYKKFTDAGPAKRANMNPYVQDKYGTIRRVIFDEKGKYVETRFQQGGSGGEFTKQDTRPTVLGSKGTKDNPFTASELKAFENAGAASRAAESKRLGIESFGSADKLPQGLGSVYFINKGYLYMASYDNDGKYVRTQYYNPSTRKYEVIAGSEIPTAASGTTPPAPPEGGGSSPAPTAPRPRPRPRADVKRVQELINKVAAKLTWLPPLQPTKDSKNGEDGRYGKDTRTKLSAIFKDNLKNMSMAEIEASLQKLLDAYSKGSTEPKEGEVIPSGAKTASTTEPVPNAAAPIEVSPPVDDSGLKQRLPESKSLRGMILKEILAALK